MTRGITVRELAQRYPLGKTTWGEYRSGARDIPLHWLERLISDRVTDARTRLTLLERARNLHAHATDAAQGARPRTDARSAAREMLDRAREAQRQAESSVRESARLIELLASVADELRDRSGTGPPTTTGRRVGDTAGPVVRGGSGVEPGALAAAECLAGLRQLHRTAGQVARAARHEHEIHRLLAARQWIPPGGGGGRAAAGARIAPFGDVDVHLPALWRVEVGIARTRAELAHRGREVALLLGVEPAVTVLSPVRGEVVAVAPAARPLGAIVPIGPRRAGPPPPGTFRRAARRGFRAAGFLAAAAALLAVGVLIGGHRAPGSVAVTAVPDIGRHPDPLPSPVASPRVVTTPPGTLYAITPRDRVVQQWGGPGRGWTRMGGRAAKVLAGRAGVFAVRAGDRRLFGYTGTPGKWVPVSGPGADFVMSGAHLYRLAPDRGAVHRWEGAGGCWTKIGGPAGRLYGGGAGMFATNPQDGRLFRYDPRRDLWEHIGGEGADFAVGDHHLYGLSPDRRTVFRWEGRGSAWTRIGGPAHHLHAGPAALFATSADGDRLLRHTRAPASWADAGTAGADLAVTADHVFRLAPDRRAIHRAAGDRPGAGWTRIGGAAVALTVSG
ncbi:hypothetical protein [Streptomyces sp. NPDC020965]|uniref:hypothetical protein n=1 Tax=Streptomyces sp. NPDC020965 TaxID=3365105 RepID=UPI0037A179DB